MDLPVIVLCGNPSVKPDFLANRGFDIGIVSDDILHATPESIATLDTLLKTVGLETLMEEALRGEADYGYLISFATLESGDFVAGRNLTKASRELLMSEYQ